MKKLFAGAILVLVSFVAHAISPYIQGDKLVAKDLKSAVAAAEQKLTTAGFTVIGHHQPKGLPEYAVLVVTDMSLSEAVKAIGGSAIIGAPIRVGVQADGSVSYVNLEYWERAYLRKDYAKAEAAVKVAAAKLAKTLGAGNTFGGEVPESSLAKYHYMMGMEYFGERADLHDYPGFDEAVKAVEANLAKGVEYASKVYSLVIPDKKIAVFGVAMADPKTGEGWWVNKIGPAHIAALPWEIYVVEGKVMALYGRYRTALAWPELGMGQFMGIMSHPDSTKKVLEAVAGESVQ